MNSERDRKNGSLGDHLANERTFLAWIRTAVGIMAFGFVLVKFTFFLKQFELVFADKMKVPHSAYGSLIGIIMVALGAAVALFAYIRFRQIGKQLEQSEYRHSLKLSTGLTVAIVLAGLLMVIYLLQSR